jgi:hypothetical protein
MRPAARHRDGRRGILFDGADSRRSRPAESKLLCRTG